jgi:hypothetical protein
VLGEPSGRLKEFADRFFALKLDDKPGKGVRFMAEMKTD